MYLLDVLFMQLTLSDLLFPSNGDSCSLQAFENFGPPTPSSVAENSSMGPTPSKRSRLAVYTPSQEQ